MALRFEIEQHAVAYPAKVIATEGGKHIYNIHITEDVDNGFFVGKGAWESFDLYTEAAPTSVSAVVRQKAANGNYYVEIKEVENALFVYQVPMIEEEYNNTFKKLTNFFNASGDVVRAYELAEGDIVEISAAGFSDTPTVGATVTLQAISGKTAKQLGA